jgi:hypothetical protein
MLVGIALGGSALQTLADTSARVTLRADGIGTVTFGAPKARVVNELSAVFGPPTWRGVNPGCGPRWTEVLWDRLAIEFRYGTFSGYRYAAARHIEGLFDAPRRVAKHALPKLATALGMSLGNTLAQVRAAYPRALTFVGTDRHKTRNGIVFVDNARHSPASLSSRIIEIKTFNTCGDY